MVSPFEYVTGWADLSTGVKVFPRQWDDRKHVINRADSPELNMQIEVLEKRIKGKIQELMIKDIPFEWRHIEVLLSDKSCGNSFIKYVEDRVENRKDIKEGTRKNHKKFLRALKEFRKSQTIRI